MKPLEMMLLGLRRPGQRLQLCVSVLTCAAMSTKYQSALSDEGSVPSATTGTPNLKSGFVFGRLPLGGQKCAS